MRRLVALADHAGQDRERVVPAVVETGVGVGAAIEQLARHVQRVRVAARQSRVGEIQQRLPVEGAALVRGRCGIGSEAAPDLDEIAGGDGDVEIVGAGVRPARQDARCRSRIALPRRAQDDLDTVCLRAPRQRKVVERLPERHPARQPMLARQRQLHVAQARHGRRVRCGGQQTLARPNVAGAQRLEPALRLFLERLERRIRCERAAHGRPSFRIAWRPLKQAGRRVRNDQTVRMGGSRLPCHGQVAPQSALPGAVERAACAVNAARWAALS